MIHKNSLRRVKDLFHISVKYHQLFFEESKTLKNVSQEKLTRLKCTEGQGGWRNSLRSPENNEEGSDSGYPNIMSADGASNVLWKGRTECAGFVCPLKSEMG